MKRRYLKLLPCLEDSSTNSSGGLIQSQGQMSRTLHLTSASLMTPAEDPSQKRKEVKAEESNVMNVKDMDILELNVPPFLRNKRKEWMSLGLMVIQVNLRKKVPNLSLLLLECTILTWTLVMRK